MSIHEVVGQKLLIAFIGKEPTPEILWALREGRAAGLTLFRSYNIDHPAQVRELTERIQRAGTSNGQPPFLIGADQEGGQMLAVGQGATLLPGNMALGATGSVELAQRAGEVLGSELAAMGININYAPSCDVNVNPANPVIGTRSFGEDAQPAAQLAAAVIHGIQARGVAATAKHFPGHGDTALDSHFGTPVVHHSLEELHKVDLPPFQAAIQAGARLIMTAHVSTPAVDPHPNLPATFSERVLKGLLREELGYQGVIISESMDMSAIRQGGALGLDAVCSALAGVDLFLLKESPQDWEQIETSLIQAAERGLLEEGEFYASVERVQNLRRWLGSQPAQPDLGVVGCSAHQAVAREIAENAVTLVRGGSRLLPLRPAADARVAVLVPRPQDLTPADTSSYVKIALAEEVRKRHAHVEEFVYALNPKDAEIAGLVEQLGHFDLIIAATLNAFQDPSQAALIHEVLRLPKPVVTAALRLPYDLAVFPEAPVYLCTYSILEPAIAALVAALWGEIPCRGRLPVSIPGLYPRGYGLSSS